MFSFSLAREPLSLSKYVYCGLLLLWSITSIALADPTFRGASLIPESEDVLFDPDAYDESILDLKQVGANTVAVDLLWVQPTASAIPSTDLIEQTINASRVAVEAIQNRGLDVFLHFPLQICERTPAVFFCCTTRTSAVFPSIILLT